jgi:hypothetical protein
MKNTFPVLVTLISYLGLAHAAFAAHLVDVAQLTAISEKALAQSGLDYRKLEPLTVYFEKRIVAGEDQSRMTIVTQPIVATEYETLRLGLIRSLVDGTEQVGLIHESRNSRGDLFFSPTSNNATLCISRKLSEQGQAATQAAVLSTTETLSKQFPDFEFGELSMLNIVTVTAPEKTTISEKIRFLRALENLDTIEDFSRIGFNALDAVTSFGDRHFPAVKIQGRGTVDVDHL